MYQCKLIAGDGCYKYMHIQKFVLHIRTSVVKPVNLVVTAYGPAVDTVTITRDYEFHRKEGNTLVYKEA